MASIEDLTPEEIAKLIGGDNAAEGVDEPPFGSIVGGPSDYSLTRVPWVIFSRKWRSQNRKIVLWVNPSTISLDAPERASIEKTAFGSVMHHLRIIGRDDTYDEMTITFEGTTGSLMIPYAADGAERLIPPGLVNLYDLVELKGDDKVWNGQPNFIYLFLSTPAFPSLLLQGWFDPATFSLSENATSQQVTYSLKFDIVASQPRINGPALLRTFSDLKQVSIPLET